MASRIPQPIFCVTFPRSGNHLLVNILLKYYSGDVDFWETTDGNGEPLRQVINGGDFYYCEFYQHCKKIPCIDHRTTFQKQHDLHLDVPNLNERKYIVQYRHPLRTMISYYHWQLGFDKRQGHDQPDTRARWLEFLGEYPSLSETFKQWRGKEISYRRCIRVCLLRLIRSLKIKKPVRLRYWKGFIRKWVLENKNPNTYFFCYEEVMREPQRKIEEIVRFISPQEPVNADLIKRIVAKLDVKERRRYKDFVYYDEKYFDRLEKDLQPEFDLLRKRHQALMESIDQK